MSRLEGWKFFFGASVELMKVLSRACSHSHFNEFELSDLQRGKKKWQIWQVSLLLGWDRFEVMSCIPWY